MDMETNSGTEAGVAIVAMNHTLAWVNDAFAKIIGRKARELCGRTFESITHEDDVDLDHGLAQRLFAGEIERYEMEKRYIHKDGSVVPIHLTVRVVRDSRGNILYAVSVVEQISEPAVYGVSVPGELTEEEGEMDRIRKAILSGE
jgi:PAS domain S-box-containing protein